MFRSNVSCPSIRWNFLLLKTWKFVHCFWARRMYESWVACNSIVFLPGCAWVIIPCFSVRCLVDVLIISLLPRLVEWNNAFSIHHSVRDLLICIKQIRYILTSYTGNVACNPRRGVCRRVLSRVLMFCCLCIWKNPPTGCVTTQGILSSP